MSLYVLQVKFAGNLILPVAQKIDNILDGSDNSEYSHFLLTFDKICLDGSSCCEVIHVPFSNWSQRMIQLVYFHTLNNWLAKIFIASENI